MSQTVAQLVALAQEYADAVGSPRWSTSTITQYIGWEQWQNQAKLLNANNQYYVNGPVTVSPNVTGTFNVSVLDTGTGDSKMYFYRMLLIGLPSGGTSGTSGPLWFRQAPSMQDYPPTQPSTVLPYVWYQMGTVIQTLPINVGDLQCYVNYRPPRADQLSGSGVTVDYPEGYEMGLAWGAASRMLAKGGSEMIASAAARQQANEFLENMLFDLGRRGTNPIIARANDSPSDWGSSYAG